MSDCRKCAEFDWCVENEDCGLFKPKTQTNADRIRAMSDEELATLLSNTDGDFPPNIPKCGIPLNLCEQYWLDWLKQEATDDN